MDSAIISAMAGIFGSLSGGSITVATSWIAQKTLNRRETLHAEIGKRERLYGEFIGECSRLILDSFVHTLEKPEKLLSLYALINRIRLTASDAVLAEAERLLVEITEQYFSPNLTVDELHARARSGSADLLKSFSDACRVELKSMHTRM